MDESAPTAVTSPTVGHSTPTVGQPTPTAASNQPTHEAPLEAGQQQNGTDRDSVSPPQSVPPLQNPAKLYEEGAAAAAAAAGLTSLGKQN